MKVIQEPVPQADAQTLRVLDLSLDAFAGAVHAHPVLELTHIQQGAGLRFVGDSVEPFSAGDLVLIAPHVAHGWWTSGPQPGRAVAQVLQLHPSSALTALPEWRHGPGRLLDEPTSAWVLSGELAAHVVGALPGLLRASGLEQLGQALALLARIGAPSSAPDRRPVGLQAPRPAGTGSRAPRRLDALLTWVRDHLHEDLSVDAAAEHLHVTPAAFSRTFKRLVGCGFTRYVTDLRLAEAQLLLHRTDLPITRIAADCGFATMSNFNAQFLARVGQTPRAYRAAARVEPVRTR
ncbi:MAG: AraC family transcriptional regulator [Burkholderiales bacterium]|nr:MAG: AraC family transcriptional regulator [Burkholderiales bacterium]